MVFVTRCVIDFHVKPLLIANGAGVLRSGGWRLRGKLSIPIFENREAEAPRPIIKISAGSSLQKLTWQKRFFAGFIVFSDHACRSQSKMHDQIA